MQPPRPRHPRLPATSTRPRRLPRRTLKHRPPPRRTTPKPNRTLSPPRPKQRSPSPVYRPVRPQEGGPNMNPVEHHTPAPPVVDGKVDPTQIAAPEDFADWDDLGCQG